MKLSQKIIQMIHDNNMLIVDRDCIGNVDLNQCAITDSYMAEKLDELYKDYNEEMQDERLAKVENELFQQEFEIY